MKKWNILIHFLSLCSLKELEWKLLAPRSSVINYGRTHNEFSCPLRPKDSTHSTLVTMLMKTPDAKGLCWAHLSVIKDVQPWAVLVMGFWCCVSVCAAGSTGLSIWMLFAVYSIHRVVGSKNLVNISVFWKKTWSKAEGNMKTLLFGSNFGIWRIFKTKSWTHKKNRVK